MSSSLRIPSPKIGDLELMARIALEDRTGTGVTLPWTPERDRCMRMGWIRSLGRIGPTGTPGRDGRRARFALTDDGRGWVDRAARLMSISAPMTTAGFTVIHNGFAWVRTLADGSAIHISVCVDRCVTGDDDVWMVTHATAAGSRLYAMCSTEEAAEIASDLDNLEARTTIDQDAPREAL